MPEVVLQNVDALPGKFTNDLVRALEVLAHIQLTRLHKSYGHASRFFGGLLDRLAVHLDAAYLADE